MDAMNKNQFITNPLNKDQFNYIFPIVQEILANNDMDSSYFNTVKVTKDLCEIKCIGDDIELLIEEALFPDNC